MQRGSITIPCLPPSALLRVQDAAGHSRSGVPVHFGITAANVHDVNYLQWMNETQLTDCELIADKGYLSLGYQTSLFEESRIRLVTPLRANMKNRLSEWNAGYWYARKRIETLFSQLCAAGHVDPLGG